MTAPPTASGGETAPRHAEPPPAPLRRSAPIGLIVVLVLLALAAPLYVLMLDNASRLLPGGEASFGQAFEALFLTASLWIVLTIILLVGGASGAMPRWTIAVAFVLVPMSGVAAFVAIDMCSRHLGWAIVFPALLPLLIAFYALWARSPRLHAKLPAQSTSLVAWGAICVLTCAPLVLATWL